MLFFCERRTFIQFKLYKLQFWPLNDQITVSFMRAAGVLAKGRMFDMPGLAHRQSLYRLRYLAHSIILKIYNFG